MLTTNCTEMRFNKQNKKTLDYAMQYKKVQQTLNTCEPAHYLRLNTCTLTVTFNLTVKNTCFTRDKLHIW